MIMADDPDPFLDLRRAELARVSKQTEFVQALEEGAPVSKVAAIKAELDAVMELARVCLQRVIATIRSNRRPE